MTACRPSLVLFPEPSLRSLATLLNRGSFINYTTGLKKTLPYAQGTTEIYLLGSSPPDVSNYVFYHRVLCTHIVHTYRVPPSELTLLRMFQFKFK